MSLFFRIVQYTLNIRYAIDTYFQVQKELKKTKTKQNGHNTHLHIYKYPDVTLTSGYTSPGGRHAACFKAKKSSQRWLIQNPPLTALIMTIEIYIYICIYTHTQHLYHSASAWWTLDSNGINTILMFIYKML